MRQILRTARREKRNLTEVEVYQLLAEYDIPVPEYFVVSSGDEAAVTAARLNYPLIMKIVSPDIAHKTDIGGVSKNIRNPEEAVAAYHNIMEQVSVNRPDARIDGVLITEQIEEGIEVVVGMTRDPQFGPTIMFGLGGVFLEIIRDVSLRICPVKMADIDEMFSEVKGIKLLQGYRNQPEGNLDALRDIIMKISTFALENPGIDQIDLNPVIVDHKRAITVDGKIFIGQNT